MTGKISEDPDRVVNGTEKFAAAASGSNFGILASSIATYLASLAQTLTNKTIDAANNTISGLTTAMFATSVVDTDSAFTADSNTRLPTQKAVKTALSGKADTSSLAALAMSLGAMATKDDVGVDDIDATGTPSSSTYLRGDGSWQTPAGGGGGIEGPVSSTDSGFARWNGTDGSALKDGAATIALGSEVSGTLPVANGGTGYTGGAFTTASGAVLKNQGGTNFGAGSFAYSYIIIGKLCIVSGRATVTTLAPNSGSDQVSIPLPVNSLSNGSFTCRNTANGRIADGRTIATSPTALIYDSVGLTNGAYFDFTIVYETV
ncbi:hypothetical protein [Nitrobacter winogradskyi]|uniref:Uncharacterized protein n=2 Tax=Nitrobacter winogradskyi TaxID=913 RepID=A0ACC6AG52_NITWI|nr:hypothetical protein [Nitrobacter winogradskyi]MCP1998266.1 hypothetical protein [Nitrobacter winogradskyi]GEC15147.1 hypothetical protein NWI01_10390 [Nitrobacter winogradskyi]